MVTTKKGRGDAEVGARIRAIRKAKQLTLKQLALESLLDHPNLSKLETGQVGFSAESIKRIARALGVPVSELFRSESEGPVFWVPFKNEPGRPMFPSGHQVSDRAFALEVSDGALAPLIQAGDIVICDPIPWSEGRAVVAEHGDELIVRKVRARVPVEWAKPQAGVDEQGDDVEIWEMRQDSVWELYADNDWVPRIEVTRDSACRIIGPVVQRITQMLRVPRTVFVTSRAVMPSLPSEDSTSPVGK